MLLPTFPGLSWLWESSCFQVFKELEPGSCQQVLATLPHTLLRKGWSIHPCGILVHKPAWWMGWIPAGRPSPHLFEHSGSLQRTEKISLNKQYFLRPMGAICPQDWALLSPLQPWWQGHCPSPSPPQAQPVPDLSPWGSFLNRRNQTTNLIEDNHHPIASNVQGDREFPPCRCLPPAEPFQNSRALFP